MSSYPRQAFCRQKQQHRNKEWWKLLKEPCCLGWHHHPGDLCVHITSIWCVCGNLPQEVKHSTNYKCPTTIVNSVFLAQHCCFSLFLNALQCSLLTLLISIVKKKPPKTLGFLPPVFIGSQCAWIVRSILLSNSKT